MLSSSAVTLEFSLAGLVRTPLVSVGIPVRNGGATFPDAIRSVLAQSHGDWELLIVDDGSDDGSDRLALALRDRRIRVVADGQRRGLAARLNEIAGLARGRYLARMDADDLMHPLRLERQVAHLSAHAECDLVGTAACIVGPDLRPLGIRGERPLDTSLASVLRRGLFIHPSVMGPVEWFCRHPYDPDYVRAEDLELWCRTCRESRFGSIPESLLFYRESGLRLTDYIASCRTHRRIARRYGPAVGPGETTRLIVGSHLAELVHRIAHRVGLGSRLVRRRSRPLEAGMRAQASRTIAEIRATALPLADPGRSTPSSPTHG